MVLIRTAVEDSGTSGWRWLGCTARPDDALPVRLLILSSKSSRPKAEYPDSVVRYPGIARLSGLQDYWRSRRTELGIELAWASMAVPA